MNMPPRVTDRAFARIAEIAAMTGQAKSLRVAVEGGGCSGFQYDIKLDDPAAETFTAPTKAASTWAPCPSCLAN